MNKIQRRVLILAPALSGITVAVPCTAQASLKKVEENEPKATAIGYRHDSAKVDRARYPKHDVNQQCNNCLAWAPAKPADEWGECDLMSDRLVNRNGWCSSYKKKKG